MEQSTQNLNSMEERLRYLEERIRQLESNTQKSFGKRIGKRLTGRLNIIGSIIIMMVVFSAIAYANSYFFTVFQDQTPISAEEVNNNFNYLKELTFAENGTNYFFNKGNVGFGLANPLADLHLKGTSVNNTTFQVDDDLVTPNTLLSVLKNGSVGIYTKDPKRRLHVNGNIAFGVGDDGATLYSADKDKIFLTTKTYVDNNSNIALGFGNNQPLPNTTIDTSKANFQIAGGNFLFNNGNVGIGTSPSTAKLFVNGTIKSPMWNISEPIPYGIAWGNRTGTFVSHGGTLLIYVAGSAYNTVVGLLGIEVKLNGTAIISNNQFLNANTNETFSHKTLIPRIFILRNYPAQNNTIEIMAKDCTIDGWDYSQVVVMELPF